MAWIKEEQKLFSNWTDQHPVFTYLTTDGRDSRAIFEHFTPDDSHFILSDYPDQLVYMVSIPDAEAWTPPMKRDPLTLMSEYVIREEEMAPPLPEALPPPPRQLTDSELSPWALPQIGHIYNKVGNKLVRTEHEEPPREIVRMELEDSPQKMIIQHILVERALKGLKKNH